MNAKILEVDTRQCLSQNVVHQTVDTEDRSQIESEFQDFVHNHYNATFAHSPVDKINNGEGVVDLSAQLRVNSTVL